MQQTVFIGHEVIQDRLKKFLSHSDESKSFLFCGSKSSGKKTLARAFARAYVNAETTFDFSDGYCEDVFEIEPVVEEKKGVVKEKKIDIEQIRESVRKLSLSSSRHHRRALIIDEAQKMTTQAQNALLKTLEEPATGVMIILVAHTSDTLLPTILSRCERVRFGAVSKEEFRVGFSKEMTDSEQLWRLSLGLPGLAMTMVQSPKMREERMSLEKEIAYIDTLGVGERLRLGEALSKNIPKAIEVLELWAFLFREKALSGGGNMKMLYARVEKMHECVKLLKNTPVNGRLILENTILSL